MAKESLGEYGSGWGWDSTTSFITNTHVFDIGGEEYGSMRNSITHETYSCLNKINLTDGNILFSNDIMLNQISCAPHVDNIGNIYNWTAMTISHSNPGIAAPNTICPKGWLIPLAKENNMSFSFLLAENYNTNGEDIFYYPLSFSYKIGVYYGNTLTTNAARAGYGTSSSGGNGDNPFIEILGKGYQYNSSQWNKLTGRSLRCGGIVWF